MAIGLGVSQLAINRDPNFQKQIVFEGSWQHQWQLERDQILQISVGIPRPSSLPPNALIEVRWRGPELPDLAFDGKRGDLVAQASSGWEKKRCTPWTRTYTWSIRPRRLVSTDSTWQP